MFVMRIAVSIAAAATALILTSNSMAQSPANLPLQQQNLVRMICEGTMQVGRNGVELAACTQSLAESLAENAIRYNAVSYGEEAAVPQGTSFEIKRSREEYACVQLGLRRGTPAFAQCVAGLDADLFIADNPNP